MIDVDAWDLADIAATALILAIRTWETPGHRPPLSVTASPGEKPNKYFRTDCEAGEINEA